MKKELFELIPYNNQKSFNGKAYYRDEGSYIYLYSYGYIVCKLVRLEETYIIEKIYLNYSKTTNKHIYSFLQEFYNRKKFGIRKDIITTKEQKQIENYLRKVIVGY